MIGLFQRRHRWWVDAGLAAWIGFCGTAIYVEDSKPLTARLIAFLFWGLALLGVGRACFEFSRR